MLIDYGCTAGESVQSYASSSGQTSAEVLSVRLALQFFQIGVCVCVCVCVFRKVQLLNFILTVVTYWQPRQGRRSASSQA